MKTAKSRQSNALFSKSSLLSTFLLVKTGSCYGSWNMPEIILWVKGHCPPHLFHAVTSVWSVRLPFTWLVACMLAYFVFFTFIHMSHQRDEPGWSRVRNSIVRKFWQDSFVQWLCGFWDMVQLLAFAKLVITKPQITCLCPRIISGK